MYYKSDCDDNDDCDDFYVANNDVKFLKFATGDEGDFSLFPVVP